jgi:hypothetical protein
MKLLLKTSRPLAPRIVLPPARHSGRRRRQKIVLVALPAVLLVLIAILAVLLF